MDLSDLSNWLSPLIAEPNLRSRVKAGWGDRWWGGDKHSQEDLVVETVVWGVFMNRVQTLTLPPTNLHSFFLIFSFLS